MERREHQVTGFRRGQRDLDGFAVAHLADEDHLRRLAQRGPERQRKGRRIAVQLALVHRPLLVLVQELDRILDGEDVFGARLVDQIDEGRQRRRLARPGRTGHQHDAVLERGGVGHGGRKVQIGERRNLRRNDPHHDRIGAALAKDVDAKAGSLGQRIGEIAGALIVERPQDLLLAADEIAGDTGRILGPQQRKLGNRDRDQVAVPFDLRRPSRGEDQVADALAGLEHGLDDRRRRERRRRRGRGTKEEFFERNGGGVGRSACRHIACGALPQRVLCHVMRLQCLECKEVGGVAIDEAQASGEARILRPGSDVNALRGVEPVTLNEADGEAGQRLPAPAGRRSGAVRAGTRLRCRGRAGRASARTTRPRQWPTAFRRRRRAATTTPALSSPRPDSAEASLPSPPTPRHRPPTKACAGRIGCRAARRHTTRSRRG